MTGTCSKIKLFLTFHSWLTLQPFSNKTPTSEKVKTKSSRKNKKSKSNCSLSERQKHDKLFSI